MTIRNTTNWVGAIVLALTSTTGQARFYTGNDMAKFCNTSENSQFHFNDNARCSGYVIGVTDSLLQIDAYDDDICLPVGVTVGQLTKVVEKFMVDNPAEMHWPGVKVVGFAIMNAFPCE